MTNSKKKEEFNPWQSYFMMGAGVCLIAVRFIGDNTKWLSIDMLKVGVGAILIAYGIFKLIKKK
ncbi:MAG: hypothetical protein MK105_19390 [Crocinitomicaceae bacterium]|nr:hypothetical protein [Crocinitomicaceae bacterium]